MAQEEFRMKDYKAIYEEWLTNPYFDEETKEELKAISGDDKENKERFYMDLEFGTAGLRGVIGAGINRMNVYTVRRATQGLADYILEQGGAEKGVAIAYDSRHMSPEFSDEAARTLAANGIKAYRIESLRPTPELSFAVRELGCIAGINITASHNPPEYNGYKVYWEDGAQFTPPHDKGVTEKVMAITDLSSVKTMSREEAEASGLYVTIGSEIDDKYIAQVKAQVVNQAAIDRMQDQISIVYTPLHGTGNIPARRSKRCSSRLPSSGIRPGGLSMRSNSPVCTSLPWSLPPISIPRKTASSSTIPRLSWLLLATRKAGMFLWG